MLMNNNIDMTDEEYEALADEFTRNPPKKIKKALAGLLNGRCGI